MTALAGDVRHVLPAAQLAVGHVDKLRGAYDLQQRVPNPDVGLVVVRVSVVRVVVHWHRPVTTDRERPDDLLEIGSVVLVVTVNDAQASAAILARRSLTVLPRECDAGRV